MISKRIRTAALTILSAAAMLLAVGCSSDNPVSSGPGMDPDGQLFTPGTVDVEIAGRVATVDAANRSLTMIDEPLTVVAINGAEIVRKGDTEIPIDFSEIMPGDSVEARGTTPGDGTLQADRIRVRLADDSTGNEVEISGRVAMIDPVARTMALVNNPTLINILPNAEVVKKIDAEVPIGLDEIVLGDSVDIRGTMNNSALDADRVRIRGVENDDFPAELEFTNTITSIDYVNGTFTVAGRNETIMVDGNTYIFMKVDDANPFGQPAAKGGDDDADDDDNRLHKPLQFTDLTVGDTVEVYANRMDANTLYAVAIELEDGAFENGLEIEFKDNLATVDAASGTVTFVGQTWVGTVAEGAELRGLNDEMLSLSDFLPGELVEVRGFRGEGDALTIVRMHKDNN